MTGYTCKRCPLAFEIGYYVYWDLSGGCSQYVCCECGTMHRIDHRDGQPDVLFALAGPISVMIDVVHEDYAGNKFSSPALPISEDSWKRIGDLPTSEDLQCEPVIPKRIVGVQLDRLPCSFCEKLGQLVSHEWPTDAQGNWPAFGDGCPKCGEKLELVYVSTIN